MQPAAQLIADALEKIYSDPVECLGQAMELISQTVDCEFRAILTVDKKDNSLAIDVLHGYPPADVLRARNERTSFDLDRDNSICLEAFHKKKPIVVSTESVDYHYEVTPGIKRVLAYPIWNFKEIVAILGLESRNPDAFREFENDLAENSELRLCASLVGGALNTRQSLVFKFDEFMRQEKFHDFDSLGDGVVEWVCDKLGVDSSAIYFVEYDSDKGDELVCKASRIGGQPDTASINKPFPIEEDYFGWVVAHNHSLLLPEYENEQSKALDNYERLSKGNRPKRSARVRHCKSYLAVPIASGGQVFGVLEIFDTKREYAFNDEALLEIIGDDIAAEYLRISKEIKRENIFAIPNIETRNQQLVIRGVVDAAMRFTEATHGYYYMYRESDGGFSARAVKGYKLSKKDVPPVDPNQRDLTSFVMGTHDAFVCPDINDKNLKPDIKNLLENTYTPHGTRSVLLVPVSLKDAETGTHENLGVLTLTSLRPRAFQEDEMTITALADIVSYHIWGNAKIKKLEDMRANVNQLQNAMNIHNQVMTASALSVATVHNAKKLLLEMEGPIKRLVAHQKVHEDPELRDPAEKIQKAYKNLDEIYDRVNDVLIGIQPRFEMCDLQELVQDARTYMEPTFQARKIDFKNQVKSPPLPKVKADVLLMKVVFINLIRNSFEAGARKITVRGNLTTLTIGGYKKEAVELTFEDDGSGIPNEDWEEIFKPFRTAYKKRGTGVGLAVNRNILEKHEGETMVISSKVGAGTTIAVRWPLDL